jgi:DNA repair photolyase
MAEYGAARVNLSITTLDPKLQRSMEPRTSSPARRLAAVEALAGAGIPVHVLVAPVIPAINDEEIPAILEAAAAAGAGSASHAPLRLPHGVKDLFADWLERHYPARKEKVLNRIREMRGGRLNEPEFGARMRGQGEMAAQVRALFDAARRKAGLAAHPLALSVAAFRRPAARRDQLALFS